MTWNVRGVQDKIKRGAVLKQAKRLEIDVLFMQETHMMGSRPPCLACYGFEQVFHSGHSHSDSLQSSL